MPQYFRKECILVVITAACALARGQSTYLELNNSASASTYDVQPDNLHYFDFVTVPTTLTNSLDAENQGNGNTASGELTSSMAASSLHAFASTSTTYGYFDKLYNPSSQASAYVEEATGDAITIKSNTLSIGTPVLAQVQLLVDGNFETVDPLHASGVVSASFSDQYGLFALEVSESTLHSGNGPFSYSGTATFATEVGAVIEVYQDLDVTSVSYASPNAMNSSNISDFSDTAQAVFNVLTPGATFSAASGASYQPTAAPEPSTLICMGLGLGFVGLVRRRRSRSTTD